MFSKRKTVWLTGAFLFAILSPAPTNSIPFLDEGSAEDTDEVERRQHSSEENVEEQLFQGDIVLDSSSEVQNQGVQPDPAWPNGIVPYYFRSSVDQHSRTMIRNAMDAIESVSCVKFRPKKQRDDPYFLKIYRDRGGECFSSVGRRTDDKYYNVGQPLRLDDNCLNRGTILHELMHALGFEHEQARFDRDRYVEIVWNNIKSGKRKHFEKTVDTNSINSRTAYDFKSIMHYTWNAFANDNRKPTITILDPTFDSKILGTGDRLSLTDIMEINLLYKCNEDTTTTEEPDDSNGSDISLSCTARCTSYWLCKVFRSDCELPEDCVCTKFAGER